MKAYVKMLVVLLGVASLGLAPAVALAQKSSIFIYPQKGQSPDQQSKDEGECRTWAKQQSGLNPDVPPTSSWAGLPDGTGRR